MIAPSLDDDVAAGASEGLGGRVGRRVLAGAGWWTPLRVMTALGLVVFALGVAQKAPCYFNGWSSAATNYSHACYSDIPILYQARGLAQGHIPYLVQYDPTNAPGSYVEYPVVIGLVMWGVSWVTHLLGGGTTDVEHGQEMLQQSQMFFNITVFILMACTALIVIAVARSSGRRPWDALLVALSPALLLNGTINWDLIAVAFTALGMWAWAAKRPFTAGVLLGLGVATKLYPAFVIAILLFLCIRALRLREWTVMLVGALAAWLVVDLPFMIANFTGWKYFWSVNTSDRGADLGSVWRAIDTAFNTDLQLSTINLIFALVVVLGMIGIFVLALCAPVRPRVGQLAFLAVALFLVVNKVYSPQYVLWLIPLAVVARPRWRDFLIWQLCEVVYFFGVWSYLATTTGKGLSDHPYAVTIIIHIAGTLYLALMVIRDILDPSHDPVRSDGLGTDDPGGGVLDRAPDGFAFVGARSVPAPVWQPDGSYPAPGLLAPAEPALATAGGPSVPPGRLPGTEPSAVPRPATAPGEPDGASGATPADGVSADPSAQPSGAGSEAPSPGS